MCQIVNSFNRSRLTVRHSWVKSREMTSYPSTQRSTIFQHVGVLIYVFGGQRARRGQGRRILPQLPRRAAETFTRGGHFPLRLQNGSFHERRWAPLLEHRTRELQAERESGAVPVTVFGTIIHHETLYWVRRSPTFVSRAFLTFALLRVSRPTSACMVENHAHHRTQRGRPV